MSPDREVGTPPDRRGSGSLRTVCAAHTAGAASPPPGNRCASRTQARAARGPDPSTRRCGAWAPSARGVRHDDRGLLRPSTAAPRRPDIPRSGPQPVQARPDDRGEHPGEDVGRRVAGRRMLGAQPPVGEPLGGADQGVRDRLRRLRGPAELRPRAGPPRAGRSRAARRRPDRRTPRWRPAGRGPSSPGGAWSRRGRTRAAPRNSRASASSAPCAGPPEPTAAVIAVIKRSASRARQAANSCVLGAAVRVDERLRHPGAGRDRVHRGAVQPLLGEHGDRRVEHLATPDLGGEATARGRGHACILSTGA